MKRATVVTITSVLLLAGCSPVAPTATAAPTPSPSEVALAAGERMLAVQSIRFVIQISGDLPFLDDPPTVALKKAAGDLLRPDSVRALVTLWSFGIITEIGIIGMGDEQYVTNPLNQRWERVPAGQGWYFDPTVLFDPEHGIEALLRTTEWSFSPASDEQDSMFVLSGIVPGEKLWLLSAGVIQSGEFAVEMWIDSFRSYVHRIVLLETGSDAEEPSEWTMDLSHFDEPITIEAPPLE